MSFTLSPRRSASFLAFIALCLSALSLFGEYITTLALPPETDTFIVLLIDLWSVNAEQTIPTWYAVMLLFLSSCLLGVITMHAWRTDRAYRWHWLGLTAIFLYLSIDEGAVIHEIFSDPLQMLFDTSGFLAFGWLILAVPLVIVFVLAYIRFLFHLCAEIRYLFVVAGAIYIGGAVVVEAISANVYDLNNDAISFPYLAIATVEETAEMLGVTVFIYALLRQWQLQNINLTLTTVGEHAIKRRAFVVVTGIAVLSFVGIVALWAVAPQFTDLDTESDTPTTRFVGNSPYHPIIVRDEVPTARSLLIDGEVYVSLPDKSSQQRILEFVLPLIQTQKSLVLSAGSQQIAYTLSNQSSDVTVIALDPMVHGASQMYFDTLQNGHLPGLYTTIVDNPADFLSQSEGIYNLIVTHFPLNIGGVYQQFEDADFYNRVAQNLNDSGVFVTMVEGSPLETESDVLQIIENVEANFTAYYAVYFTAENLTLIIAGDQLTLTGDRLSQQLRQSGFNSFLILDQDAF